MAHIRMTRAGRAQDILSKMARDVYDYQTVHSIAKLIRIKPSTYLRGLMNELVSEGELVEQSYYASNGHDLLQRVYALPNRALKQGRLRFPDD